MNKKSAHCHEDNHFAAENHIFVEKVKSGTLFTIQIGVSLALKDTTYPGDDGEMSKTYYANLEELKRLTVCFKLVEWTGKTISKDVKYGKSVHNYFGQDIKIKLRHRGASSEFLLDKLYELTLRPKAICLHRCRKANREHYVAAIREGEADRRLHDDEKIGRVEGAISALPKFLPHYAVYEMVKVSDA